MIEKPFGARRIRSGALHSCFGLVMFMFAVVEIVWKNFQLLQLMEQFVNCLCVKQLEQLSWFQFRNIIHSYHDILGPQPYLKTVSNRAPGKVKLSDQWIEERA